MKIMVEDDRLVLAGRNGSTVRFADIAKVAAEKVGKVTYDEIFLIVVSQRGEGVTLGELDEGFADAERALRVPSGLAVCSRTDPSRCQNTALAVSGRMTTMGGKPTLKPSKPAPSKAHGESNVSEHDKPK